MADRLDTPSERKFKLFRRRSSGDGFGQFAEATARFLDHARTSNVWSRF